jgi:phosphomannomutase
MARKSSRKGIVLFGCALLAGMCAVAMADASGKWRIAFDHWAEADGELVLRVAPVDGIPIDISTTIPKNTTENSAADLVKKSLKTQLGKGYKVEIDDGEDVLIKKSGKTPKFEVSMVSSSVTGLNVKIKHD